jgi:hypothetical protein
MLDVVRNVQLFTGVGLLLVAAMVVWLGMASVVTSTEGGWVVYVPASLILAAGLAWAGRTVLRHRHH